MIRTDDRTRGTKANLASVVGAGVLGAGLGALVARYIDVGVLVVPLILAGALVHAWGMFERHRLAAGAPPIWWSEVLYWLCWAALLAIGVLILLRL